MARYINAEKLVADVRADTSYICLEDKQTTVQHIISALGEEVVEREKIDKAIEEVDRYLFEQEFGSDYRKDVKEILNKIIEKEKQ